MEPKRRGRPPKVKAEKPQDDIVRILKETVPAKVMQPLDPAIVSSLALRGDIGGLNDGQKVEYYRKFCEHLGLNPVTQPFDILNLKGKLVLYANRKCADQLRKLHGVSILSLDGKQVGDTYVVTAVGKDSSGRQDSSTGAVTVGNLTGDNLCNAIMKAETKAKRRLTLSLCGLGILDETEIETVAGAMPLQPTMMMPGEMRPEPIVSDEKKLEALAAELDKELEVPDAVFKAKPEPAGALNYFAQIMQKLNTSAIPPQDKVRIVKEARDARGDNEKLKALYATLST